MLRKVKIWVICQILCAVLACLTAPFCLADTKNPEAGQVIIGEEGFVRTDDGWKLSTDFHLFIELPGAPFDDGPVYPGEGDNGKLPKTGDSGPSLELVLYIALICGTAYLYCDRYENKAKAQ